MAFGTDYTPVGPMPTDIVLGDVDATSMRLARDIRDKGHGIDTRETMARMMLKSSTMHNHLIKVNNALKVQNDEYYRQFTDAISEFRDLKPRAELSISQSAEALTKSRNALNVANGIDAKATNALNLSKSADTLSKSVQEQFNQVVIDGDSSVEAAQARVGANGERFSVLKNRLDSEHLEVKAQFNGKEINAMFPPPPFNPVVSDAKYYDEVSFKYFKDPEMTIPATDNTAALQALVDFVHNNGGGRIFIPSGKYVFRSSIKWKSKVSLRGASKLSTSLYAEGSIFSLIDGTIGASTGGDYAKEEVWFDDCEFTDLLIDNKGLSHTEPNVGGKAFFILYMRRALFRDLILLNTIGTALGCDFLVDTLIENVFTYRAGRNSIATGGYGGNSGIGIGTSALEKEPVVVSNCFTYDSGNYGVFVETQHNPQGYKAKYAKIVNCHAQGNRLGFGNKGSGGTQFIGCTAVENKSHGFHLTQGVAGDQLTACISEGNFGDGIRVESDYIGDLDISNTKLNDNHGSGFRALSNINILEKVRLSNVKAENNGGVGLWFGGKSKDISILNSSAINNAQDSTLYSSLKRGILIQGENDIVSISGNTVYDDQETKTQIAGIDISATTTNYIVDGNNVIDYGANAYLIRSNEGTIGNNNGLKRSAYGQATIPDGQVVLEVIHGLGTIPKSVVLTPFQYSGTINTPVWVDRVNGNMFRARKSSEEGEVEFYYDVKL